MITCQILDNNYTVASQVLSPNALAYGNGVQNAGQSACFPEDAALLLGERHHQRLTAEVLLHVSLECSMHMALQ